MSSTVALVSRRTGMLLRLGLRSGRSLAVGAANAWWAVDAWWASPVAYDVRDADVVAEHSASLPGLSRAAGTDQTHVARRAGVRRAACVQAAAADADAAEAAAIRAGEAKTTLTARTRRRDDTGAAGRSGAGRIGLTCCPGEKAVDDGRHPHRSADDGARFHDFAARNSRCTDLLDDGLLGHRCPLSGRSSCTRVGPGRTIDLRWWQEVRHLSEDQ